MDHGEASADTANDPMLYVPSEGTPMTPALATYLQAVSARCEQATPGPWTPVASYQPETGRDEATADAPYLVDPDGRNVAAAMIGGFADMREVAANVRFMAGARTDLPTLVRLVRDAHAALEHIREAEAAYGPFVAWYKRVIDEALARAEGIVKEGGMMMTNNPTDERRHDMEQGVQVTTRQIALEKALEAHRGTKATPEDIVATAKTFLSFLMEK